MRLGETLKAVAAVATLSLSSCETPVVSRQTCDEIRKSIQEVNENECILGAGGPAGGATPAYHDACEYKKARLIEELKFELQEENCK